MLKYVAVNDTNKSLTSNIWVLKSMLQNLKELIYYNVGSYQELNLGRLAKMVGDYSTDKNVALKLE